MKTERHILLIAGAVFWLAGCQGADNAFLSSEGQEPDAVASASASAAEEETLASKDGFEKVNISVQVNVYNGRDKRKKRKARRGGAEAKGVTGDSITLKRPPAKDEKEKKAADSPSDKTLKEVKAVDATGASKPGRTEATTDATAASAETTPAAAAAQTKAASEAEKDPAEKDSAEKEKPLKNLKKADILFYLAFKGDGTCWDSLSRSVQEDGFFSLIKDSADWRVATAFQADKPELYSFRKSWGFVQKKGGGFFGDKVYVLDKDQFSDEESDEYLGQTIQTEYVRDVVSLDSDPQGRRHYGEAQFPLEKKPPADPLSGLAGLLDADPEDFKREDSKTVVVLLEFDHYYYTKQEWKDFQSRHKGVQFVALSSHRGTGANYPRKLKKSLLFCNSEGLSQALAERIQKILSKN